MGYQLKITIKNSHPPIWRRILIPDHITFFDLDDIIEAAFGWEHNHLFAFHFKDSHTKFVGTPIPEDSDTAHACIDPWIKEGISFTYTYDFGDNWIHTVKVEKIIPYDERYPQALKSKGPNMTEDCGGIWGFYNCINEAEPFDLEAVNSDFKNWSLPETNPESEPYDFDPDLDEWEIFENLLTGLTGENKENQKQMEEFMMEMKHQEQEARQAAPPLLSLEDVFLCYSKDEMKQIACYYGFTGYNKFNKKELAQWLKNHLLDTVFMKKQWLNASEDEIHLFEAAITEQGITMSEDLLGNRHLLMTYGGFGGFGGNGSFSGSYSSNGGPFTHQEFHFENGSGDMDDIFSMFGDMFSHGGGNHSGWSTSGNSGFTGNSGSWSNFSGGRSSAGRKGSDVMADLTISFDEAVFGCEKSISLQDPTTGKVSNLSIHIPAGIESGKTVRLKGQGNPGRNGGAAGDVLLKVNVTPSREFERKGQNVYSTIRVPFTTAARGGKARVHTLYGDVECSIKAGTQGGSKIRLKGKGISSMKNPSVKGDQYVTVEISVPRRLTPRAKEALEEYRAVC